MSLRPHKHATVAPLHRALASELVYGHRFGGQRAIDIINSAA